MQNKTPAVLALIAALMASAGGAAFLHKHPNPTLREVYVACEKGEVSGVACCEDMLRVKNMADPFKSCGMIQPGDPDPLGIRKQIEDAWDVENEKQAEKLK